MKVKHKERKRWKFMTYVVMLCATTFLAMAKIDVFADEIPLGTDGVNGTITVNENNGVITVTGSKSVTGDIDLSVLNKEGTKCVIGASAFADNRNINSVILPENTTRINMNAFGSCLKLKKINIPAACTYISDNAFLGCGLEEITIPQNVEYIGERAFAYCGSLAIVRFANVDTQMNDTAFAYCDTKLTFYCNVGKTEGCPSKYADKFGIERISVDGKDENDNQTEYSVAGGKIIVETETIDGKVYATIKKGSNLTGEVDLSAIEINADRIIVGLNAFAGNNGISKMLLPKNTLEVKAFAFEDCSGMKECVLPEGLTVIGAGAFYNAGIENIVIPASCEKIEGYEKNAEQGTFIRDYIGAFENCKNLVNASFGESDLEVKVGSRTFKNCENLQAVVLPKQIIEIGDYAFDYCSKLKEIIIADSCTKIGIGAFSNCSSLEKAVLPNSCESILRNTFFGCEKLSSVTIPNSYKLIESYAFAGCSALTEIAIYNSDTKDGVVSVENNAFTGMKNMIIKHGCQVDFEKDAYVAGTNIDTILHDYVDDNHTMHECNKCNYGGVHEFEGQPYQATDDGKHYRVCPICNLKSEEEKHSHTKDTVFEDGKYICATCKLEVAGGHSFEDMGDSTHMCTCGVSEQHSFTEYISNGDASCMKEGTETATCVCGAKDTRVDKNAERKHIYDDKWSSDANSHFHAAICGHDTEVTDKEAHKFIEVIDKVASKTETGLKHSECSVCGYKTSQVVIPVISDTTGGNGTTGGNSTAGGNNTQQQTPQQNAAKDDNFVISGTEIKDVKNDVVYNVIDKQKKEIEYKATTSKKNTVVVPEKVEINKVEYKVTKISDNAFLNNKDLVKIVIGKNIVSIGKNAFKGCTKLKSVTGGKNVVTIGTNAFKGCKVLPKITLESKVKKIGKNTFNGCKKLKKITIKSKSLTSKTVASKAFSGLQKGTVVKVPKSKVTAYKKLLMKKGLNKNAKVKK